MRQLQTLRANGTTIRYFRDEDGTPYLCGIDIVAATGLGGKLNVTNIRRRTGDGATKRLDRRDYADEFGRMGRPDILFFEFGALRSWAGRHPSSPADNLMRGLMLMHFSPFEDETAD